MNDDLWAGVEWKCDNAAFHLELMQRAVAPPAHTAMNAVLESSGERVGPDWQRPFYAHLDAFLSTARSVPEILRCCFGEDRGSATMRAWFDNLSPEEQARRREFNKQFQPAYTAFRDLPLGTSRHKAEHREGYADAEIKVDGFWGAVYDGNPIKRVPATETRSTDNPERITADHFLDICRGYVAALQEGVLTERQREIAIQCSILQSSCAKVGLIALIDEATGYQYERAEDALQVKLRAFIADELRGWEKTFPDELWEEFGRLTNWQGPLHTRPKWWGKLVIELIYDTLDSDVAEWLKKNKPPSGLRWHQQLTENYGARKLVSRCYEIIGMGKTCSTIRQLRDKVAHHYGKEPIQLALYLPREEMQAEGKKRGAAEAKRDEATN